MHNRPKYTILSHAIKGRRQARRNGDAAIKEPSVHRRVDLDRGQEARDYEELWQATRSALNRTVEPTLGCLYQEPRGQRHPGHATLSTLLQLRRDSRSS
ncbi:unnamed protein product [Lampetra planeri]